MLLQDYCIVAAASSAKQDVKRMNMKNILFVVILCSLALLCPAYAHGPHQHELSLTGGPDTCVDPYGPDIGDDPYYLNFDWSYVDGDETTGWWEFWITWDPNVLSLIKPEGFTECDDLNQKTGYIHCVCEGPPEGEVDLTFIFAEFYQRQPGSSTKINVDAGYFEDDDWGEIKDYYYQTDRDLYICGENNVPEFPGLILPILGVIGFLISVIYLRSTRKP